MNHIRVVAAALSQTPLDWEGNKRRILEAISETKARNASILLLPELCISGYGCEDAFYSPYVRNYSEEILSTIIPETAGIILGLGLPQEIDGKLFNAAALVADTKLLGLYCKQILANDGVHYEARWFHPWAQSLVVSHTLCGQSIPTGDILFDCGGVRLGFEICRDAWLKNRIGIRHSEREVDILLNPSASHFAFHKFERKVGLVQDAVAALAPLYIYSDMLGNEAGRIIYEGGCLIADKSGLIAGNKRFSYEEVTYCEASVPFSALTREKTTEANISCEFEFRLSEPLDGTRQDPLYSSTDRKFEEFTAAVSLGLFDYLRKSHSKGFVISMSGGADSASAATLVAAMIRNAIEELGIERFKRRLHYIETLQPLDSSEEVIAELLTCVYQRTKNNSEETLSNARAVSQELGAAFFVLEIDSLVDLYTSVVSEALQYKPTWKQDDLSLQNIQARTRAPSVWMIANLKNALLLATSNRSEAAVGYTTMDGDTCGGISPIAGIDKAFLLEWMGWISTRGFRALPAVRSLSRILSSQPSAELRPLENAQSDEADLMPYRVLDRIERLAIRDKLSPKEVYQALQSLESHTTAAQLKEWVIKFFTLWYRNQWKRERYAPSFHLDDENLDPKSWCRFPILSGGYQKELEELEKL